MVESVIIACHECARNSNIPLSEARHYNKNNHYICQTCRDIDKGSVHPTDESSLTIRQEDSRPVDPTGSNGGTDRTEHPIFNAFNNLRSDQTEIRTFADPDVNAEIARTAHHNVFYTGHPINRTHTSRDITLPTSGNPKNLDDYEKLASDRVKKQVEEFQRRKDEIDRQYQAEQERIRDYDGGGRGIGVAMFLPIIIMIPIVIFIFLPVLGTLSSITNCQLISNNMTAQTCVTTSHTVSLLTTLMIPLVIIFIIVMFLRIVLIRRDYDDY